MPESDETKRFMAKDDELPDLTPTVKGVALLFEGGGMREAYSAGIANMLQNYGLFFDYVSGISAGSTTTANYLSRDPLRTKRCFVDGVTNPNFGGIRTFLQGKGYFSAEFLYEIAGQEDGSLPFDFATFQRNPAACVIGALNADTGQMRYWDRSELDTLDKLMRAVRASSTLPVLMPPIEIDGHTYMDGGLRDEIPLAEAERRGYDKFFVVSTRPRTYRAPEPSWQDLNANRVIASRWPKVQEAMATRYQLTNATLERLEQLSAEGRAHVVYPNELPVKTATTDYIALQQAYDQGLMQGQRELPLWLRFLEDNLDERLRAAAQILGLL